MAPWFLQPTGEVARELDAARALGADIVRVTAPWPLVQPERRGGYDWGFVRKLDWMLRETRKRRLKVVVQSGASPCWASTDPQSVGSCSPRYGLYPPSDARDYAHFLTWLVRRYARSIDAIELWNEPNNAAFYAAAPGRDAASEYVRVARAVYPAVKRANRRVTVLAGALALADTRYLQRLYDRGLRGSMDALSLHPYDIRFSGPDAGFGNPMLARAGRHAEQWAFDEGIDAVRRAMARNGDRRRKIWLTEFGYATCPAEPYCVSAGATAGWLRNSFRLAARRSHVAVAMAYTLRDLPGESTNWEHHFGLLNSDFTPKPAFRAVRETLRALRASR
jgi:hypothetical protein